MSNVAFLHTPQELAARLPDFPERASDSADSPFWCGAIGSGAALVASLASHIDVLSHRIGQLPVRAAVTRPVVGQYLSMLRTLAAAWHARSRPALVAAIDALVFVGDTIGQPQTLAALARQHTDGGRAGARMVDTLLRRLAAPVSALGALHADFGSYLAQMACASQDLECDTALVTERVQSDYVHAFLLSQQATALQSKLDDANVRQRADWLLGPHAEQLRQEIALHGSALEGVRRQLDQLRAEQAATRAEADYLQSLMPSLSTYLAAVERMGAGIAACFGGAQSLQMALAGLEQLLSCGQVPVAEQQLIDALPHWQALAASAASLRPPSLS